MSTKKRKRRSALKTSFVKEGQIIGQRPQALTKPPAPQASARTTRIYHTLIIAAICLAFIAIIRQTTTPVDSEQLPAPSTSTVFTEMQLPDTPPPDVFIFPDKEIEL